MLDIAKTAKARKVTVQFIPSTKLVKWLSRSPSGAPLLASVAVLWVIRLTLARLFIVIIRVIVSFLITAALCTKRPEVQGVPLLKLVLMAAPRAIGLLAKADLPIRKSLDPSNWVLVGTLLLALNTTILFIINLFSGILPIALLCIISMGARVFNVPKVLNPCVVLHLKQKLTFAVNRTVYMTFTALVNLPLINVIIKSNAVVIKRT